MTLQRIILKAVACLFIIVVSYGHAYPYIGLNPRAIGMGGAYSALARDYDAPLWNPANLGLSDGRNMALGFFNAGVNIRNNSLSLEQYNKYTGQFLDDDDKEDIVNSMPEQGVVLDIGAEASALNFSMGNFAINTRVSGFSSMNMGKDAMKLLLLGNAVMREVDLANCRGESFAVGDLTLSFARALHSWREGEISIGASLHYLKGLAYGRVVEADGAVVATDFGFAGSGFLKMRSALGGTGYATDIGVAMKFRDDWYFSAAWHNLLSKVRWNSDTEEHVLSFDMQPITVEDFMYEGRSDSLVASSDTSYSIGSFGSKMTPALILGIARNFRKVTWTLDWQQTLFNGPGMGVAPRFASGIEYRIWDFLPLRTGMATGGEQGTWFSLGFGFKGGLVTFDFGAANAGTPLPANSKGFRLAMSMGLIFR
jgi:hypothetical protein